MTTVSHTGDGGQNFSVQDQRLMNELINDGWIMTPFMTKTGTAKN